MPARPLNIAMVGNPNSGKTTIFNALTAEKRKVGNYPGVTVEQVEGTARTGDRAVRVTDLPGTYSLTAYSEDELIARNFIIDREPDVLLNIVDCSNLERNLYLTTQLLELDAPLVVALNKADIAEKRGLKIDVDRLSKLLGVEMIATVGCDGRGIEELFSAAVAAADAGTPPARRPDYGGEVEPHVTQLADMIREETGTARRARWYAVKLIEGDETTSGRLRTKNADAANRIIAAGARIRNHLEGVCGDSPEIILADRRYGYISGACTESIISTVERRHDASDQADRVITHPLLGLPIFALMMYLLFQLTFWIGNPLSDLIDAGIHEYLIPAMESHWQGGGLIRSLVIDGVIEGVGAVLIFVPLIVLVFLGVSVLEDSGYMARAAFITDRLMHRIGLHGQSFVPMIIGFGCTVPAIMATRALKSRRDRLITILILPLMSCGARIPIYILIVSAFFPAHLHTPIMWSMYVIGIVLAVIVAKVLALTVFRGEASIFVMELPPYRKPTLKGLGVHIGERTWMYLRKAGTVILAATIVLWALTTFPRKTAFERDYAAEREQALTLPVFARAAALNGIAAQKESEKLRYTVAGRIGKAIEPIVGTMGFDWKIGTALIGAMAAKELFVAQLGIVYATGEPADGGTHLKLQERLRAEYTPLVGFCIMLFCLISLPCVATLAATVQEAGGWRWGVIQVGYLTVLAWIVTTIVYQVGSLPG